MAVRGVVGDGRATRCHKGLARLEWGTQAAMQPAGAHACMVCHAWTGLNYRALLPSHVCEHMHAHCADVSAVRVIPHLERTEVAGMKATCRDAHHPPAPRRRLRVPSQPRPLPPSQPPALTCCRTVHPSHAGSTTCRRHRPCPYHPPRRFLLPLRLLLLLRCQQHRCRRRPWHHRRLRRRLKRRAPPPRATPWPPCTAGSETGTAGSRRCKRAQRSSP